MSDQAPEDNGYASWGDTCALWPSENQAERQVPPPEPKAPEPEEETGDA